MQRAGVVGAQDDAVAGPRFTVHYQLFAIQIGFVIAHTTSPRSGRPR